MGGCNICMDGHFKIVMDAPVPHTTKVIRHLSGGRVEVECPHCKGASKKATPIMDAIALAGVFVVFGMVGFLG